MLTGRQRITCGERRRAGADKSRDLNENASTEPGMSGISQEEERKGKHHIGSIKELRVIHDVRVMRNVDAR